MYYYKLHQDDITRKKATTKSRVAYTLQLYKLNTLRFTIK